MVSLRQVAVALSSAISVSAFAAVPAQGAALFSFDFLGRPNRTLTTYTQTVNGLTVTGTAREQSGAARQVRQSNVGLGVAGGRIGAQIDGGATRLDADKAEILSLTFQQKVKLVAATFVAVDQSGNDDFRLLVDGQDYVTANLGRNNPKLFPFLQPGNVGRTFDFTVTEFDDDYALRAITVQQVPEATPLVGMMAIAAIALLRRQNGLKGSTLTR